MKNLAKAVVVVSVFAFAMVESLPAHAQGTATTKKKKKKKGDKVADQTRLDSRHAAKGDRARGQSAELTSAGAGCSATGGNSCTGDCRPRDRESGQAGWHGDDFEA